MFELDESNGAGASMPDAAEFEVIVARLQKKEGLET